MSGGKQSARDKMIGMMYLVLTALLALQVSNSVLEKFIFINEAFQDTNSENIGENVNKIASIEGAIAKANNKQKAQVVLDKAKAVRAETERVFNIVEAYKKQLIDGTGGYDENNNLLGQKDIDMAPALFINQGEGEKLKEILNDFTTFLIETTGDSSIHKIAKDANEIPVFAADPNQREKGFADLNFGHNTPMVGALASLSQFQSDMIAAETKALIELADEIGAEDIKFDKIVPVVMPVSSIVAAGTKYEAKMFIAASSSSLSPTMTLDGNEIPVNGGNGVVSFTATPGNYDKNGMVTKSFIAAIKVARPTGGDTTFVDTIQYVVSKPVMEIQSASVSALYLGCANELTVQVQALGNAYNPSFNTKGAINFKGTDKGVVTIVPNSAKVTLSVSSNGSLIGTRDFKVRRIPKPEMQVYSRNKEVNIKRGFKKVPSSIEIRAIADEGFSQFSAKDARFRVTKAEINLVRFGRSQGSVKASNSRPKLNSIASKARKGDAIIVEIKEVQRKNYKGVSSKFNNYGPKTIIINVN
jgi:gliding motility-associated protein GldM